MQRTVLCIESESLQHPELIGLEGENLLSQSWLQVFTDACKARSSLREQRALKEAWVVSSDSVEGINLAAALKRDDPQRMVSLVSFDATGSIATRCDAAGVRLVGGVKDFIHLYAQRKCEAGNYPKMSVPFNSDNDSMLEGGVEVRSNDNPVREGGAEAWSAEMWGEVPGAPSIKTLHIEEPEHQHEQWQPSLEKDSAERRRTVSSPKTQERSDPFARIAHTVPVPAHDPFVLSVVSGSGGSGKSTIAASAAVVYQQMGYRTVILDADLQFGDISYLMGRDDALDVVELLAEPERISRIEGSDGMPAIIAAPSRLEHSEMVSDRMSDLLEYLKLFYEVIVVNTGSTWSDRQIQLIERSNATVFVLDQRPSSIRACDHALDLCERCGIATQSFHYVLNFCSRHALLTSLDASCALRGVSVLEVKDGGKEVAELLGAGLPKELILSKNLFSQSMQLLCRSLLSSTEKGASVPREINVTPKKRGLLSSLKGRRAACL